MTRLLLRLANGPLLVLLVALGVALQTSLFNSYPFLYIQPDVVLVATVWCALRRKFEEGGILTLVIAEIAELHSAAPQGLFLICYMLVYLGVRLSSRMLVLPNLSSLVMVTLASSIGWKISYISVLWLLGETSGQWRHFAALLFPGAVMAGAISIWIYRWLEKFDQLTYKDPRSSQSLEDELQLEGEGL